MDYGHMQSIEQKKQVHLLKTFECLEAKGTKDRE